MKRVLLPKNANALFIPSVPESATPALAANEIAKCGNPVAVLLEEDLPKAEDWAEDTAGLLEYALPQAKIDFHTFDHPPQASHPDAFDRSCDRVATLTSLLDSSSRERDVNRIILIAATPDSILSPCPVLEDQKKSALSISPGMPMNFEAFCKLLAEDMDYSSEILCEEPGQFAVRGGLIDVYPVNGREPVRIDFLGDEIEDLRSFDPTCLLYTSPSPRD